MTASSSFSIGSQLYTFDCSPAALCDMLLQLDNAICSPLFEDEHIIIYVWTHIYVHTEQQLSLPSHITGSCIPILGIESTEEYSSMYMTCMLQVDLSEHQQLKCMGTRYKQHHHCSWTRRSVQVVHVYFSLYIAGTCTQMCTHTCTYNVNYTPTDTW